MVDPSTVPQEHAVEVFSEVLRRILTEPQQQQLCLFLDVDGTLSEVAPTPAQAIITPEMRAVVEELSRLIPVSIVSGRGTEDVQRLVDLPDQEIFYAGSHGFDIRGPNVALHVGEPHLASLHALHAILEEKMSSFGEAVLVEDKRLSLSVHYRNIAREEDVAQIIRTVEAETQKFEELVVTHGKCVVEIRINVDWNKGRAVTYLLNHYQDQRQTPTVGLYLGDDRTDEDAFWELVDSCRGTGIVVMEKPRPSHAPFFVNSVTEVCQFLQQLLAHLQEQEYKSSQHLPL